MGACLKNRCKRRVLATITACVMAGSVLLSGCSKKGTYHIDTKLWSADIPRHFERDYTRTDAYDENYFTFYGDPDHPSYDFIRVSFKTETAYEFEYKYREFFSIRDYAEGKLPTTTIDGYEFVEYTTTHIRNGTEGEEKNYVYRYAPGSMTAKITLGTWTPSGSYEGYAFLEHLDLKFPYLGLSDPPFICERGELRTNVSEAHLNEYTVTPVQCRFSEPVFYATAEDSVIAQSETAGHVAASEKYLYLYSDVKERLYVYLINGEEMTLVTTVPFRGKDDITVDLLDGDFLTVYTGYPLLVENAGGKETILSCDPDIVVSPDEQTIIYRQSSKLHYDPQKKEVTSEPFELNTPGQIYRDLHLFVTNTNIYVRAHKELKAPEGGYSHTYHVFEYDLDGKLIREYAENSQKVLDMKAVFDLGDELLIVNGEPDAIELWDKEGNCLAGAYLSSLIGHYGYGGNCIFPSYSLVRCGKSSDFILVSAYGINPHLVEDLVYRIHIE